MLKENSQMRNHTDHTKGKNADVKEASCTKWGEVYNHVEAVTWNSQSTSKDIDTT